MSIRKFFRVLFGGKVVQQEELESAREVRAAMESLRGHITNRRRAISYASRKMAEADELLGHAAAALKTK